MLGSGLSFPSRKEFPRVWKLLLLRFPLEHSNCAKSLIDKHLHKSLPSANSGTPAYISIFIKKRWSSPAVALQQDTLKVSYLRIKSTPQLDALSPTSSFFFPVAFPNRANRLSARFSPVSFHNFRALSCSRLRSDIWFLLVSGYCIYL
jgi:hypothetical protein